MIDLYVIMAMPFISFLVVVIYIIEIPSFILAMPRNMILAVSYHVYYHMILTN